MNGIPWFSTFTLVTETLVTASILYIFYTAYFKNHFAFGLAGLTLAYEILFNISYMAYRALTHVDSSTYADSPAHIALAAFHGIFSLLMFVLLLVFMFFAWRGYRNNINFFQKYKKTTIVFLFAWFVAVLSGFVFYYEAYFSPEELLTRNEAPAALSVDVYPLYTGLTWGAPHAKADGQFVGTEVVSQPIKDISNLAKVSIPFDTYYANKLKALGWTVDNALAAGGPGAGVTAYKKADKYIIVSYHTDFKGGGKDEPVRCPCDITFSVFSN